MRSMPMPESAVLDRTTAAAGGLGHGAVRAGEDVALALDRITCTFVAKEGGGQRYTAVSDACLLYTSPSPRD